MSKKRFEPPIAAHQQSERHAEQHRDKKSKKESLQAYGKRPEELPGDEQLHPDGHDFGKGREQMSVARAPGELPDRGEREQRDHSQRARLHCFICVRSF